MELNGIVSAVITPFSSDGESVNEAELRAIVESGVLSGLGGFVPCGGTGEFATLSFDERQKVTEICIEQAAGRSAVMAQVGACSTREAIAHAKHAQAAGADAMMLATPYYEGISFEGVRRFYHDIAAAVSLPICIYNFPPSMGVAYDPDRVAQLMEEIPSVKYIKDSSGDFGLLNALVTGSTGVKVFAGEDILIVPSFTQGCAGVINGSANFIAPACVKMFDAAKKGDFETLRSVWDSVNPLVRAVISDHYNGGVKAAVAALGFATGPIRKPYDELPAERFALIQDIISKMDPSLLNRTKQSLI
ncbi:dihydrodipicolinate synthase [Neokomagataea thailandica NBRC 106555]|nr:MULTISPECIES: dihydrodipicolinate synthase family protein [Neokomagataea]GBR52417.1 dihydrodipicolinate synthase [Neokomagataea thailandica NBRC 106555]